MSWSQGYVVDIPYIEGFYAEQSPQHLALAAALNGFEVPDLNGSFTYCDLGCGKAQTTLTFAAAYPKGQFYGVDFNPAHIAHGEAQARAAGIDNIVFCERSFADLINPSLPPLPTFDVVAMHGVWSWIAPEAQQDILRFLDARLKPGGLLYISYNAMPGWANMMPLQRVLKELAALWPGRSDRAADNALTMMSRLAEKKVIPDSYEEGIKRLTDRRGNPTYLAHEYLNDHWQPTYHVDAVRALGTAKLTFAASTQLVRNFGNLGITDEQRNLLAEIPVAELRDTIRDFCIGQWFHQDVYVRGARRMTEDRRAEVLGALRVAQLQPSPGDIEISGPSGMWRPNPDVYRPVMAALDRQPHTVNELLSLPELPSGHKVTPVELIGVLCGPWLIAPYAEADAQLRARCEKFNRLAEAAAEYDRSQTIGLLAPSVRTSLKLPPTAFELYRSLKLGEQYDPAMLARRFVRRCFDEGTPPIVEGRPIENEADAITHVQTEFEKKVGPLIPVWRTVGLI